MIRYRQQKKIYQENMSPYKIQLRFAHTNTCPYFDLADILIADTTFDTGIPPAAMLSSFGIKAQ
ncbi:hypothetical protein JCM14036_10580 [Desulfotomaculum defluvii]